MAGVSGYGEDIAAIHAAGFTGPAEAAARELLGRLAGRARIVDLGCGDGTTAALLTAAGHEVHGIDASPALIALARERAPGATFAVGSFVDAELPGERDAVLAVNEVLGYALDPRYGEATLDVVFARVAGALRRGGVFLLDLAGPGRVPPGGRAGVTFGDGWAVLAESRPRGTTLVRRVVAYRNRGDGVCRTVELHRLVLHERAAVLARLRAAGFTARMLPHGYAGSGTFPGVTAFAARRR
jgi:SAM-dependent methyltransferase